MTASNQESVPPFATANHPLVPATPRDSPFLRTRTTCPVICCRNTAASSNPLHAPLFLLTVFLSFVRTGTSLSPLKPEIGPRFRPTSINFCRKPTDCSRNRARRFPARPPRQGTELNHFLYRLPQLDRIPIRIFHPRKNPHPRIFLGLFDGHAFTLQMAQRFRHVLHRVINLSCSRLILDVVLRGHNRPRDRSLDFRVCQIAIFERGINRIALRVFTLRNNPQVVAIPCRQFLCIVCKQKSPANSVDHLFLPEI